MSVLTKCIGIQKFIDFKKPYDSVRREVLFGIPMELG
jgi:hypothetical protein